MESRNLNAMVLDSLEPEICFLIRDDFYYGPDRHADLSERKLVEKLIPPMLRQEFASIVRTTEARGHEKELADYYWQIVSAARRHAKDFNHVRHYFWMRLWLSNAAEKLSISFPWYDSLSEMRRFSDAIATDAVGDLYWDEDQGWRLDVKGTDDRLLIHQRDPDSDDTGLLVSVPRGMFLRKMTEAMQDATAIVARLTQEMGADVWTAYVRDAPVWNRP
ncbi:hypothetical protein [Lysobacter sp. Root983]|uniref:hypothetical protein n=1 Tax=Lysobacter sp. Root983 TaxID=1736613 RepID=UPI0012F987CB|nr:hypothetical protein [Lysobacter sp. Root983]